MRQTIVLNFIVLGFFVFLFSSLQRRRPSARLRLWIAAWICAVFHFGIGLWRPDTPLFAGLVVTFGNGGLLLCGLCFLLSFSGMPCEESRYGRRFAWIFTGISLPLLLLSGAVAFQVRRTPFFFGLDLVIQALGLVFLWSFRKERKTITIPGTLLILASCQWSSFELVSRHEQGLLLIVLMEFFALNALLYAHQFPRRSAGVLTTIVGLLGWAAVFPLQMLAPHWWPTLAVQPEIWNVPKVVVAFGMLVTLFENELNLTERDREQYRSLFDSNPLPMWIFDKDSTQLLEANATAVHEFGWDREDLPQLTVNDLLSEGETSPVSLVELNWRLTAVLWGHPTREAAEGTTGADSMRFQTKSRREIVVEVTLQRVDFAGREARLLVAKDVTERAAVHEQLIHLANHDPLTGLPNRLLLQDRMRSALANATRHGSRAAILCVDLDRFKQINDTFGHAAGDSCLREIANRFRQRLRSVDTAARTGGEEFMIVLDGIGSLRDAERVAGDLLFSLNAPHTVDGAKIQLSASIGIAVFPDDGDEAAQLWSMADTAMYRAKHSGGNRHMVYSNVL